MFSSFISLATSSAVDASWHYTVDDKEAVQSFEHAWKCWTAGSTTGNNQGIQVVRKKLVPDAQASKVSYGKGNTKKFIVVHETDNTHFRSRSDAHARLQYNGNSRLVSTISNAINDTQNCL